MKILLAVDGSDYSKRMLDWLATHDDVLAKGTHYTFLTVVLPMPPHVGRYISHADMDTFYGDSAKEVLEPIAEFARGKGWQFETRSVVGSPATSIAEAATGGGFDMVVMGSHGHTSLGALLLGSVAQRVLSSCGVPVLIVR